MRYFPVVAMFVSASAFTIYLLSLDYEFQNWELDTMLIVLSPVFLAGFLVWIMKFPDSFARLASSILKLLNKEK